MAIIDDLNEKYPQTHISTFEADELPETLYFRKPSRVDVKRYMADLQRDPSLAVTNFVNNCLLHPSREVLKEILDTFPALENTMFKELTDLAGGGIQLTVKNV